MKYISVAMAVLLLLITASCVETGQAVREDEGAAGMKQAAAAREEPVPDSAEVSGVGEKVPPEERQMQESRPKAPAAESVAAALQGEPNGTQAVRSGSAGTAGSSGASGAAGGPTGQFSGATPGGTVTTVPIYVGGPVVSGGASGDDGVTDGDTEADGDAETEPGADADEGGSEEDTGSGIDTEYIDGLIADGDYYANNGDAPKAAGYYQQAVNEDPGNQTAVSRLNGVIELVTQFGLPEDVAMVMQELIVYAPENAYYRYTYGRYMLSVGFVNEAYSALELAASIEPGNPVYLTEFGNAMMFRGDYAGALVNLETAVALDPSYNMAYVKKAYVFIKTGSEAEGRDIISGVLDRAPSGFVACYAYALLGDKTAMLEQLNQVMATEPYLKWFIRSGLEFGAYRDDPDFVEALNSF